MNRRSSQTIGVTGTAVLSPVGLHVTQACAAVRAGVARFAEHPYYRCAGLDPEWDEEEPLMASLVPSIDPYVDGPERLFALLIPPLANLMAETKLRRKDLKAGAFLLALPQADPVIKPWSLEKIFIDELRQRTGLDRFKVCKSNQSGHAGMFSLLSAAMVMLEAGEVEFCIVGGVAPP